MNYTRPTIAAILCSLSLTGAAVTAGQAAERAMAVDMPSAIPAATTCTEDSPCWVWSKMGNRKRGVVTMWGTPLVVGPCRFSRLYHHGNLSYPRSEHMRGDRWAIAHGCKR